MSLFHYFMIKYTFGFERFPFTGEGGNNFGFSLSEWINDTEENNSVVSFFKFIIYDLVLNLYISQVSFCNILTFCICKAFDSIPDF